VVVAGLRDRQNQLLPTPESGWTIPQATVAFGQCAKATAMIAIGFEGEKPLQFRTALVRDILGCCRRRSNKRFDD
jgi:hypothetical protein